jgi:hypothetical protein
MIATTMKTVSALVIATGFLFDGAMNHASALPNNKDAGLDACFNWCIANRTGHQQDVCIINCTKYYGKHPGLSLGLNYSSVSNPPTEVIPPRTDAPPLKSAPPKTPPEQTAGPVRVKPPVAVSSNPGGGKPTGGTIFVARAHHK